MGELDKVSKVQSLHTLRATRQRLSPVICHVSTGSDQAAVSARAYYLKSSADITTNLESWSASRVATARVANIDATDLNHSELIGSNE